MLHLKYSTITRYCTGAAMVEVLSLYLDHYCPCAVTGYGYSKYCTSSLLPATYHFHLNSDNTSSIARHGYLLVHINNRPAFEPVTSTPSYPTEQSLMDGGAPQVAPHQGGGELVGPLDFDS